MTLSDCLFAIVSHAAHSGAALLDSLVYALNMSSASIEQTIALPILGKIDAFLDLFLSFPLCTCDSQTLSLSGGFCG